MDASSRKSSKNETEAEREARYFEGYRAIPDSDEDFMALDRLAVETLRSAEEEPPAR